MKSVTPMSRILIIGSNGAGKTTFAYTLRDLTVIRFTNRRQVKKYLKTAEKESP